MASSTWRADLTDNEKQVIRDYKKSRYDIKRQYLDIIKSENPCTDCDKLYHPVQMQFDHVRGEKVASVGSAQLIMGSWTKLLGEIEKCELVCANCHALRTARRAGWRGL